MFSTDVILETSRAVVLLVLVGYLWRLGKKKGFIVTTGWRFIQLGFLLILFGSFLDITDNFESLNPYVVVGDTETEAFLEKIIGYLAGFIFLTIGLMQWMPTVEKLMREIAERKKAEAALQKAHDELEIKVEERTKDLRKSEAFSKSIIENEPECIKIIGQDGILEYMNPAGLAMIEADTLESVVSESVYPIVKPEYRNAFIDLTNKVLQGGRGKLEFQIIALKGTSRWLETHAVPLFDNNGKVVSLLGLTRDITEHKYTEEELVKSEERHRRFAADVAHELRTPLSVLKLHLDDCGDAGIWQTLQQDVKSMTRLVEQLLTLARLDGLDVGVDDKADLHEVCKNVAVQLAPIAIREKRNIELVGQSGPFIIHGNSTSLEQAIRNLVENAIKYSARESTITIDVREDAKISVIDRGRGVPVEIRDDIFDRFQRSDHKGADGSGLGLSIVQRIVESHGGSIEISDTPGGGATFTVNLVDAVF